MKKMQKTKKIMLVMGCFLPLMAVHGANCKVKATEEVVRQFASSEGHIIHMKNDPTETLELENGKKFEIWTTYITNLDQSNEKAAVVQLNGSTCEVLKFNFLN